MTETRLRRGYRFTAALVAVAAIWFAGILVLTLATEPVPAVLVFGPPQRTLAALDGSQMTVLGKGRGFLVVGGDKPGFVRALYRGGAWLVFPAFNGGCGSVAPSSPAQTS